MFFGKKTQAELDAAFLKAVGRHKFDKAKKLLTQGANVLAVDAEGNTALHKLAGYCPYEYSFEMDPVGSFIDFLISRQLDINALNHQGQNCLYSLAPIGRRAEKADWMMHLLVRRGASRYIQDLSGMTLLHAMAFHGVQGFVDECSSSIDKQDKVGCYPHDMAQAGGYPVLAQDLLAKFEKKTGRSVVLKNKPVLRPSRERAPPPRAVRPPPPPPRPCSDPVVAPEDRWFLMTSEEVAHVSVTQALGYKITETFNFHSRTHTKIVHNMETKTDTVIDRSFDECPDKIILEDAYHELVRLDGKADRNSIYGRVLKKDAPGGI